MKQSTLRPILLSDLCSQLLAYLESIHMKPRTINNYKLVLRKILSFAEERGECNYSEKLINDYICKNGYQDRAGDPGHMYYRTCRMIHDLAIGSEPSHSYSRSSNTIHLSSSWSSCFDGYRNSLLSKHQSPQSIRTKLSRLKIFFIYLMKSSIFAPEELNPAIICDYICYANQTYKSIYKYNMLQTTKDFLLFLYLSSRTMRNHALLLSSMPDPSGSVLPTHYSPEEIRSILSSVDLSTLMGKRDFAIIQLIAQTGLRAIDVANLKLEDINPTSLEVKIAQHKTKKRLHIPLTEELRSTLYYYLSSRSDYKCPNVFIRTTSARSAFPVTSDCISSITKKYIHLSGINSSNKKTGAHSLRHSLAVSMSDTGTPFPIISKVLGHSSTEVTKKYAGISLTQLRVLALEVLVYEG